MIVAWKEPQHSFCLNGLSPVRIKIQRLLYSCNVKRPPPFIIHLISIFIAWVRIIPHAILSENHQPLQCNTAPVPSLNLPIYQCYPLHMTIHPYSRIDAVTEPQMLMLGTQDTPNL